MLENVVRGAQQLTLPRLTQTLQVAGVLAEGQAVTAVRLEPFSDHYAETAVVHLEYNHVVNAPDRLFLKRHGGHRGKRETAVYEAIGAQADFPAITIPCYEVHYDSQTGDSRCLLADFSSSHGVVASREAVRAFTAVPSISQLTQVIGVLAQWHAFWWEHPCLHENWVVWPDELAQEAVYLNFVQEMKVDWLRFKEQVGRDFPDGWRDVLEDLLQHLPALGERYFWTRFSSLKQLTLAHGDCYFGNFLYARGEGNGRCVLFDFDNMHVNFSGEDLVLLLATFWLPAQRRQYERNLLQLYHAQLQASGVGAYAWEDLVRDYRLGIIWRLFHPIWGMLNGEPQSHWQTKMGCLMGAYEDWNCWEFIKGMR